MANLFENLIIRLQAKPDASFNTILKNAKKTVNELTGEITSLASSAGMALGGVSVGIGLIVNSWLDAAGAMEQYEAKLTTVLKSAGEAKTTLKEAVDFAARTPFEVSEIVNATVQLEVYGQKAKKWLPLVGDLAAGMGKDLGYASQVMGKALSGSYEGFESLRNELGITTAKLVQYGAVMSETGGISLKTSKDLEKARQALHSIIKTEFGGAMERQAKTWQGAMSNLKDSIDKLQVTLGEALIPSLTKAARGITFLVEAAGKIPKPFIALAAYGTAAAGALGVLGGAGAGLVSILPSLSAGFDLVTKGLLGETLALKATALGVKALDFASSKLAKGLLVTGKSFGIVAAGVAVGVAVFQAAKGAWLALDNVSEKSNNNIIKGLSKLGKTLLIAFTGPLGALAVLEAYWEKYTEKMTVEIAKQEKALRAARMVTRQFAGKTIEELRKMGVTTKELEGYMNDLSDAAKDAFQRGDKAAGKFFVNQIREIARLKTELSELEKQYSNLTIAIEDVASNYSLLKDAEVFKSAKEEAETLGRELDDLFAKFNRIEKNNQTPYLAFNTKNLEETQRGLVVIGQMLEKNRKAQRGAKGNDKTAFAEEEKYLKQLYDLTKKQYDNLKRVEDNRLKKSEDFIRRKKDLNQMSIADEIKANQRMLAQVKGDSEKEIEIRHNIAKLKKQLSDEARNKVEEALKDELDSVKDMTTGQIAEYDKLIKKIKEYIKLKKIDAKDGNKLIKEAEKGKKAAVKTEKKETEKKQKEDYDKITRAQKDALDKMTSQEEKSVYDRIKAVNSYIRYWKEEERKRPAFKKQIEDKILDLVRQRSKMEADIVQSNKEAEKELRSLRTDALNYEISKLEERLEKGEDVEEQILEKIQQRHKIEMLNISEQIEEWRRKGVTQDKIEERTALLKQQLHQKEVQQIDDIIKKLKEKKDEEKKEEDKKFGQPMTIQEAFRKQSGFLQASEEAKKQRVRQETIASLEAEKARIEAEKSKYDEKIKQKQKEMEFADTDEKKELAQSQINQYEAKKKSLETGGAKPEQLFSSSVDVFSRAVDVFSRLMESGFQVNKSQYQAIRGNQSKSSSPGINIIINVKGQQSSGNKGVTAQQDSSGNLKMTVSKEILANARGEVSPVGQSRFQGFMGGNSLLGGAEEAFAV